MGRGSRMSTPGRMGRWSYLIKIGDVISIFSYKVWGSFWLAPLSFPPSGTRPLSLT